MNNSTLGSVRKLKNVVDGTYLFNTDAPLGSGASGALLGRPVFVDPTMPDVGAGTKPVAFGDFSKYWVRFVGGIRFERSNDVGFVNDIVAFRALARMDGALIDTSGAVKHFAGGSA